MSQPTALTLSNLRVDRGGQTVLRVETLEVAAGETVAILGPNGSGKSTLLLTSALLLSAAEGRVSLFGHDASDGGVGARAATQLRRRTATVFQEAGLLDMSVRRNVETALRLHRVPSADRRDRAEVWLDRLGVGHLADARAHMLSGGEAQRVSLARAFAVEPELLFLDEPFSSLDLEAKSRLVGELRTLLADEGIAAVISTHDHSEAQLLAERAMVLLDGRVEQVGPTAEVFSTPASIEVARFLGYAVIAATRLAALRPPAAARHAVLPPGSTRLVGDGDDIAARLGGPIVAIEGALGHARVVVDVGERLAVSIEAGAVVPQHLAAGVEVQVAVDPTRVLWL
jgi:tungstate transport system ATP-binding protein